MCWVCDKNIHTIFFTIVQCYKYFIQFQQLRIFISKYLTCLLIFYFVWDVTCMPSLNTLDTIGNCQRPVFSLGVAQHMHKQTNLWKFELNWLRSCEIIMEEKTPLSHKGVCFQMLDLSIQIFYWEKTSFSKTFFSWYFRGRRFSQCFILSIVSIACYQLSFYSNNYFE